MALKTFDLSKLLEEKPTLTRREKLNFVWNLSIPGMLAQISSILMQYIDAAMVGGLGENASAAIGLVASSTWVIGSLTNSLAVGYTVQVAHAVGEGNQNKAKRILIKSIMQSFTPQELLLMVWPLSISLATTLEIESSFFSCWY